MHQHSDRDLQILRQAALLSVLEEQDLARLAAAAEWSGYARGELIALPEELHTMLLVILHGSARLCRFSLEGQSMTVDTLRSGESCGILFANPRLQPRSFVEATADDTIVCRLPVQRVRDLVAARPIMTLGALELAAIRLLQTYDRLADMGLHGVNIRLAHELARLALADAHHMVWATHQELAWKIGTTREKVTEGTHCLRRRGLIVNTSHHHGIAVPDVSRLAALEAHDLV
ncbi:MAG: Crp/Fnr family transcriptional regulator [Chloroflexota bacterium]